jgi:hypothetical protein
MVYTGASFLNRTRIFPPVVLRTMVRPPASDLLPIEQGDEASPVGRELPLAMHG